MLVEGENIARQMGNGYLLWIAQLMRTLMISDDETDRRDAALDRWLTMGRHDGFLSFFCWPRGHVIRLIDRAIMLESHLDYVARLVKVHRIGPPANAHSDQWHFKSRMYTFRPSSVAAVEPTTVGTPISRSPKQARLLAVLLSHGGTDVLSKRVTAEMYSDDDPADQINNLKGLLTGLRTRLGGEYTIRRESNTLSIASDEIWLSKYYQGDFLEDVTYDLSVEKLRETYRTRVATTVKECLRAAKQRGPEADVLRLKTRWGGVFPELFVSN